MAVEEEENKPKRKKKSSTKTKEGETFCCVHQPLLISLCFTCNVLISDRGVSIVTTTCTCTIWYIAD